MPSSICVLPAWEFLTSVHQADIFQCCPVASSLTHWTHIGTELQAMWALFGSNPMFACAGFLDGPAIFM